MLAELETKRGNLQQTLLRISGAIQVLEDLLSPDTPPPSPAVEQLEEAGKDAE